MIRVEKCSKGILCTHEEDDPVWKSPCVITEATYELVNYWIRRQYAPDFELPEGREWAGDTVVIHLGPMLEFLGRRSVVFTRNVNLV